MTLDFRQFFTACNPSRTLSVANPQDRKYYIDFSSARGGNLVQTLKRTITMLSPDYPTCQLFSGHIGCGKSTELLRLKAQLESEGFHVVYFESTQDLDMADVDISDILLAISRQVSESLESSGIRIVPKYFTQLFNVLSEFLQTPIEIPHSREFEFSGTVAAISAKAKASPQLRMQMRQYLEPRTNIILQAINEEFLHPATRLLKERGQKDLVVIVDNLDRVDPRTSPSGRSQHDYLFIDRGEQLRRLGCHVVYTVPLTLVFSNESEALKNRLGGGVDPKVLPMVPVRQRNGQECFEGMALLRQMILVRAFPDLSPQQGLNSINELFDSPETLDRLCYISGGHLRNLLGLLYRCLQEEDPPFTRECVESVIRDDRDRLLVSITDDEWKLLFQLVQQQSVSGYDAYQVLLRSLYAYEYRDQNGRWFSVNPVLEETKQFKEWVRAKKTS